MDSPMEYVTTSMSRRDSFSSEASGSLKPTAGLRNRPDCPSELDNIESTVSITVDASIQNDSTPDPAKEEAVIHARAYQIEMFEESLKQNIIVAMETGSGKTQV
ncbi:hypothetical protein F5Y19DRAFT_203509 [Xylariaceae sp. FL1651]|nr:hypothetical protein F5Y19DRAFT_203509 [Xylariaceae sp. FL1651]